MERKFKFVLKKYLQLFFHLKSYLVRAWIYLNVAVIDAKVQIGNDKLDGSNIAVGVLGGKRCYLGFSGDRRAVIQIVIPLTVYRL